MPRAQRRATVGSGSGKRHLHQGPLPGHGRAQLVRGIGHELPLRPERALQPGQQPVHGVSEKFRFSSSSGPVRASRWCKLLAEVCCAAAVMVRSGRSTRPDISQPRPTARTVMAASAMPEPISVVLR